VTYVLAFFRFWRDFIVGDDWRIAAGAGLGLLVTWLVARAGVPAWWLLPLVVLFVLCLAVWRGVRAVERPAGLSGLRLPRALRRRDPARP
jgi:hypothetical protein